MIAAPAISGAASLPAPQPDYFKQVIPEPYRILGLRLLPLSVGRYRLLKRFECAFVADGEAQAGVSDLLLGVIICSMRVDDFTAFAASDGFTKGIRRWSRRVLPHPWVGFIPGLGKWYRDRHAFNIVEKMALFQKYIEEAQRIPRYTMLVNSPSRNSSHWSHSIEVCLRAEQNWTTEEVNEVPLSKALADYFRHAESNGALALVDDEMLATAEYNAGRIDLALKEFAERQAAAAVADGGASSKSPQPISEVPDGQ